MVNQRNLIVLTVVALILIASLTSVQAEPPAKPGNPGLPGCLAQVAELEAKVAELEAQIATLNASLKYKLPKTGQKALTYDWAPGSDGELQLGMAWPDPRFTDNGDGTVTDNLTDLVWMKNAGVFPNTSWYQALLDCDGLGSGWRLPNRNELLSLLDINLLHPSVYDPPLPDGHPFINLQSWYYWTSTMSGNGTWGVDMSAGGGSVVERSRAEALDGVWCVRDAQ